VKKKRDKHKEKDFDERFDQGIEAIDFTKGVLTEGLSRLVKIPPMNIPAWLNFEIEKISKIQANSKASVIRQLLVEAIRAKKRVAYKSNESPTVSDRWATFCSYCL